ncbi:MAG TPA: hypothetical protein VN814_03670 [Caulobacteraceae bacterium]|nr:hypothetical protein [Caulobacteraceae bacterium]
MAWYEFKDFERAGGTGPGRLVDAVTFEAADQDAARSESYRRIKALPPGHFGLLLDSEGNQLDVQNSPDERS